MWFLKCVGYRSSAARSDLLCFVELMYKVDLNCLYVLNGCNSVHPWQNPQAVLFLLREERGSPSNPTAHLYPSIPGCDAECCAERCAWLIRSYQCPAKGESRVEVLPIPCGIQVLQQSLWGPIRWMQCRAGLLSLPFHQLQHLAEKEEAAINGKKRGKSWHFLRFKTWSQ